MNCLVWIAVERWSSKRWIHFGQIKSNHRPLEFHQPYPHYNNEVVFLGVCVLSLLVCNHHRSLCRMCFFWIYLIRIFSNSLLDVEFVFGIEEVRGKVYSIRFINEMHVFNEIIHTHTLTFRCVHSFILQFL